ncbi:MAG: glycosyltransferase family 4 protein [Opitutaceae bacterium]|nr:glycosyltransferase family 4 protein [Opitutaceae bacterium]
MRVAHLLRKYNPAEWGGTETVIHQMFEGLRREGVDSVVYCPALSRTARQSAGRDPLAEAGCIVQRFDACVPIWGISPEQRRQMIAVGGNLMSFDLIRTLWTAPRLTLIHSHALGRVGGIGMTIARRRRIPFVVTVHGGVYDLPEGLRQALNTPARHGVEWGKLFGMLLRARHVLAEADAIFTCNRREAELLQQRLPDRRVIVQPHAVRAALYEPDHRATARAAFPQLRERDVLLAVGRVDPVKNQGFLVEQMPEIVRRHPRALLVLAGPCTDEAYGPMLDRRIADLGLQEHVLLTGKIPPSDPRLIGLMQSARVALLPSVSETFGLVILEAWAAGTPAVSSRTSGATALIEPGRTGWLFDLHQPAGFHAAVDVVLTQPEVCRRVTAAARERVIADYDTRVLAARIRKTYQELAEEHHALRNPA